MNMSTKGHEGTRRGMQAVTVSDLGHAMTNDTNGRKGRRVLSWIVVSIVIAVVGFPIFMELRPIGKETVVGTYICHYPYGIESLELRPDGVFSQVLSIPGKPQKQTAVNGNSSEAKLYYLVPL